MTANILVVEDEPAIQELIAVNLSRAGHRVRRAGDVEEAQRMVDDLLPDVVLVDWMLPTAQGVDLVRRLRGNRRTRRVSIVMLSARAAERDKVTALDAGADDYVTKPFSPRELLARIAAVLRRRTPHAMDDVLELGGMLLDPATARVTVAGRTVLLGPGEFRLLHFLMRHADRVHNRAQLLDGVWGDHAFHDERTVDARMRVLRNTLAGMGREDVIQTVRGVGYRLRSGQRG